MSEERVLDHDQGLAKKCARREGEFIELLRTYHWKVKKVVKNLCGQLLSTHLLVVVLMRSFAWFF